MPYETLDHTADYGFIVHSDSLEGLFIESAEALFREMVENFDDIAVKDCVEIELEEENLEDLFISWLNELLFHFEAHRKLFRRFEVKIEDNYKLQGKACGEEMDTNRHEMVIGIKSATYHELKIWKNEKGWHAKFICDV